MGVCMNNNQKNKLKRIVSAGPSGGKNGLFKWVIALVVLLVAGGGVGIGGLFNQEDSAPSNTISQIETEADATLDAFDGSNFDRLPKMVKLPVLYNRVVDGDTQILTLNGHDLRVRHLMIDTPESVKEGTSVQPFGKDASERNNELLSQADEVYLMLDVGPATDQYDRVLAYVYADDVLVAEQLLEEGLASVRYVNAPNNSFEEEFLKAQDQAEAAELNIWSIDGYVEPNGYFNQVD